MEGQTPYHLPPTPAPRHVLPRVRPDWRNTIFKVPQALEDLIEFAHPDFLMAEAERHSDQAFTITVLTIDYKYIVWRAHLSLDDRWTLSPVIPEILGAPYVGEWEGRRDGT